MNMKKYKINCDKRFGIYTLYVRDVEVNEFWSFHLDIVEEHLKQINE